MNHLSHIAKETLRAGWALLTVPIDSSLLGIANAFGRPISSRPNGSLIDILRVIPSDQARRRSLSSIYGADAFPWHTDMAHIRVPPHFTIIRSHSQQGVRPTLLLDSHDLCANLEDESALRTEIWLVNGGRGRFLTPVLNRTMLHGASIFRYDACVMRPVDPLSRLSVELMIALTRRKASASIQWRPGLCLVLDNWRMLHARPRPPVGLEPERSLERVLVADAGVSESVLGLRRVMAKG